MKYHNEGKSASEISKILSINRWIVYRTIKRYEETGSIQDRFRKGRPRSVRTPAVRKLVRERVRKNPVRSIQGMAKDFNISTRSMGRIVKEDIGLKCYKFREVQLLSEVNKRRRYEKCLILRKRFTGGTHQRIVFSDEKIFTVEMAYNRQNSRILARDQKSISSSIRTIKRTQKPASVMVWGAITSDGRTPLVFIDQGVKINKEVYVESILENALKPWAGKHFNCAHWVFQQDSAPSHKAKMTSEWLNLNVPDFIEEWPASSPDLNPMDFCIWSILESRVCAKPHKNIESLKSSLRREWEIISEDVLRAAADNFYKRLSLCIKAKGNTFEDLD